MTSLWITRCYQLSYLGIRDIINFHNINIPDRTRTYTPRLLVESSPNWALPSLHHFRRNINLSSFVEFYIAMPNVPDLHRFLVSYWVADPITYDLKQVISDGLVNSLQRFSVVPDGFEPSLNRFWIYCLCQLGYRTIKTIPTRLWVGVIQAYE